MKQILIMLLLLPLLASAQQKDNRQMTINKVHSKVTFEVMDADGKTNIRKKSMYYWLKSQAIHQSVGDYEGRLLDGEYVLYYANNNLQEKGQFDKGLKQGEWKSWHNNGQLKVVDRWKHGRKNGLCTVYDSLGIVTVQYHYKKGMLHGTTTEYQKGQSVKEIQMRKGEELPPKEESEKKKVKALEREMKKEARVRKRAKKQQLKEQDETLPDNTKEKQPKWWPFDKHKESESGIEKKVPATPED